MATDHIRRAWKSTQFPTALISSVLIYLTPTASISTVVLPWLLQPVLTDCNSLFPTYLYHSVTSDRYSTDKPTDCSSLIPSILNSLLASTAWYSYDIIPVSGCWRQQAVTGLWRFCVCKRPLNVMINVTIWRYYNLATTSVRGLVKKFGIYSVILSHYNKTQKRVVQTIFIIHYSTANVHSNFLHITLTFIYWQRV